MDRGVTPPIVVKNGTIVTLTSAFVTTSAFRKAITEARIWAMFPVRSLATLVKRGTVTRLTNRTCDPMTQTTTTVAIWTMTKTGPGATQLIRQCDGRFATFHAVRRVKRNVDRR